MPPDLTQVQADLAKLGSDLAAGAAKIADAITDLAKVNADVAALIPPLPSIPTIVSVVPNVGDANGGTAVHITGTNFTGTIAVTFNLVSASFTVVDDTTLAAGAPAGTAGPCSIVVTNGAGSSAPNTTFAYQVVAPPPPPAPAVTSVSPNVGPSTGGTVVTLTGTNFTGATAVTFNGAPAPFTVINDTSLQATVPAGAVGSCNIVVTTPSGSSAPNNAFTYQTVAPPLPVVLSVVPNTGNSAGGTVVQIIGSGFTGAIAVTFGGVSASFVVDSDTSIHATTPATPAGPLSVVVTGPAGSSAQTSVFTSQAPAPVVSSASPNTGIATGGTVVTLTGTGFTGATGVTFNGVAAQSFSVVSDTRLTAVAPSGTAGQCSVVVTTAGGSSGPNTLFTYQNPVPVISSVNPTVGVSTAITPVTLTGTSLTGVIGVTFNGVSAPLFAPISDTSLSVQAPAGAAGPCSIIVTTPAGSSTPFTGFAYQVPTPPATGPSPDGTLIFPNSGGSIRDAQNHIWSLGGSNGPGQLLEDGAASHDPGGGLPVASVLTILSGNVWYEQASNSQWWAIFSGNYVQQSNPPIFLTAPPPPPPPPPNGGPPAPTGTIVFAANAAGNHLDSNYTGFSFEKESMCVPPMYNANNAALIRLMKLLSPQDVCLRWGANEFCRWNSAGDGTHYTLGANSDIAPSNVRQLSDFVHALNAKVIYDVPIQGDNYNPPNEADEIAFVDSLMGDHVLFYQFGNEPDLNGAFNSDYWIKWNNLYSAVKARVPNAKFGGPSLAIPSSLFSRNDGAEGWEGAFANMMGGKLECLTHHYYAWLNGMGGQVAADPRRANLGVWSPDGFLVTQLLGPMQTFVQRNNIPGGFRLEECGSINSGGQTKFSDAFADAIWVIDFCFQSAQYGCRGINHHGGNSNPYAWWDNDFSTGTISLIKPTYYGMLFLSQMLPGKLMDISSGVPASVRPYGIANDDGSYSVGLINADTNPVTLTIQLPVAVATASSMVLKNPSGFAVASVYETGGPPSGGTTFGGASVQLDGTWNPTSTPLTPSGSSIPVTIPAQSAMLVKAK